MSSGLITNIILDYLFVFRMGMGLAGAAIATVIAQAVVAAFNLSYLFRNNRNIFSLDSLKLSGSAKTIIRIGVSPFGQTLIPSVIIIFTNWQCIRYGGDDALSVFSLLSYVLASVQLLLQGVGDGVQPLLSFYYGAGQTQHIRFLFKKAISASIIISLLTAVGVSLLRAQITTLFGLTGSLAQQAQPALIITACSFLMVGITRCISAYFYAVEKTNVSTLPGLYRAVPVLSHCPLDTAPVLGTEWRLGGLPHRAAGAGCSVYRAVHPGRTSQPRSSTQNLLKKILRLFGGFFSV